MCVEKHVVIISLSAEIGLGFRQSYNILSTRGKRYMCVCVSMLQPYVSGMNYYLQVDFKRKKIKLNQTEEKQSQS